MLRALRHVWLALEPLNIPWAHGRIALATWKYVRATRDIDLLLGTAEDNPEHLIEVLKASGFRPKHSPPISRLGQLDFLQLIYEPAEAFMDLQIDLLLAKSAYHRKCSTSRTDMPG